MPNSELPVWAVLVASGTGTRMQSAIPKQYLSFQGKTILEHSLDRLNACPEIEGIVLVIAEDDRHWETMSYRSSKPLYSTSGGAERHQSVYQGLLALQKHCGDEVLALIHDAVRPLVAVADLSRVITAARGNEGGAILAARVADTLKLAAETGGILKTVSRTGLWRAFTPQVFNLPLMIRALEAVETEKLEITDDASAIEYLGYQPELVAGDPRNIKITAPEDLGLAEAIWLNQRDQQHDE